MKFSKTEIPGVFIVEPEPLFDDRGYFARTFCKNDFKQAGLTKEIVQINNTLTLKKGTVRGMHFQKYPKSEIKLVRCVSGSVYDVVVDLRENSPQYLSWIGVELSKENFKMLYIPEGCAHGFQTLEDNSEMLYMHTEFYAPESEGRIAYNDDRIKIEWPLEVTFVSSKDAAAGESVESTGVKFN